jgi:hypothetical protein
MVSPRRTSLVTDDSVIERLDFALETTIPFSFRAGRLYVRAAQPESGSGVGLDDIILRDAAGHVVSAAIFQVKTT